MSGIFAASAATADRLLNEFGDSVTLGQPTTTGPAWAGSVTTAETTITAVIVPVTAEMRAGHVDADAVLYCRPPVPLRAGDSIKRGSERWRVSRAVAYVGQGVTALFEADLKWAS